MAGLTVSLLLAVGALILSVSSERSLHTPDVPRSQKVRGGIADSSLILDLLAAMLSAGASVENALAVVAESCEPSTRTSLTRVHAARLLGASWDAAWDTGAAEGGSPQGVSRRGARSVRTRSEHHRVMSIHEIRQGLQFATTTGAPSAALLRAHAHQLRRRHNREIDRRAAALGVQLVLPLGLCSLPAFICLGVVPVVLGLLPAF